MRPAPIPAEAVWEGGERIVMGPPGGDLTDPDIASVEMIREELNGVPVFSARCILEPGDIELLQKGAPVWVTFYGHVVPFAVTVEGEGT